MARSREAGLVALVVALSACGSAEQRVVVPSRGFVAAPVAPPPPRDSDHDGVADGYDACPTLPGVPSPVVVQSGCPPPGYYDDGLATKDRDGDGVPDDADACPEDPGRVEARGCAAPPDGDHDGLADDRDACPADAGPARDDARTSGCPAAWIDGEQIRILSGVRFASGSGELLPESAPVLDGVGAVLAAHADIEKVRVEGHTDGRGAPIMNRTLSVKRARSVVAYLVAHGVPAARLEADGFGPDRPIDTNDTEEGRATNRRVEFHLLRSAPPEEPRATATFADLEGPLPPPLPPAAASPPAAPVARNPAPGAPSPAAPAPPAPLLPFTPVPSLDTPGL